MEVDDLNSWARELNYEAGTLPFNCLGLPIGAKSNKQSTWKNVLEKNGAAAWSLGE